MSDGPPRRAAEHHSWWPGWIWSVPVAALGIVGWLAVRSLTQSGPTVKVMFPEVADLRPGDTKVEFQGLAVGQVESIKLQPDLKHLEATLNLHADLANSIGPGTQFWIIGKNLSFTDLSAVKSLITGVSIGIYPHSGQKQTLYHALASPPPLDFEADGTRYVLHAGKLGSVQRGTKLYYLGEEVGEVTGTHMTDGSGFAIDIFVKHPDARYIRQDTRFWRAGPVELSHAGGGTAVQFQSIPALFSGAIAFDTPGGPNAGKEAAAHQSFPLFGGEDEAENAPDAESVAFHALFHQAGGVPKAGAAVTLLGQRVGSVKSATLQYNPQAGHMQVAVTLVIDPRDIPLTTGAWTNPRPQVEAMMSRLVAAGLHAKLSATPPLIGAQQIALDINGPPGTLGPGAVPELPVSEGGGGLSGITSGVNQVIAKIDAMPLEQIGDNLRAISAHLARITSSPALLDTIHHLDRTSASLQRVAAEARTDLPPALDQLRRTVAEAQQSLASAKDLLSAQGNAAAAPGSEGLPEALGEITRAARSLRELTDFLDRHPSSLLVGRGARQ